MNRPAAVLIALAAALPAAAGNWTATVDLTPLQRTEDFRWNIAGDANGQNPNILSELSWTGVRVQQLRLAGELRRKDRFALQASWTGGQITGGRNRDSDYLGDNRSLEFSRSNNNAGMGRTRDARVGVGLPFPGERVEFTPWAGWAYASERLFMTDGLQTVDAFFNALGPFPGLNSHYDHRWQGLWVGLEAAARLSPRLRVTGTARYHPHLNYRASADWNLRPEFNHPKSYEHAATGRGRELEAALFYDGGGAVTLGIGVEWRRWRTGTGLDRTFYTDGTTEETRLNEVRWNSFSLTLTARFRRTPPEKQNRAPAP